MNPKEIKNQYPKTWRKFIDFCKVEMGKEKHLSTMANVAPEKEDDMALLMIAVSPAVLTAFFDQNGKHIVVDITEEGRFFAIIKPSDKATIGKLSMTRKEAEVDGYEKAFKLMENEN